MKHKWNTAYNNNNTITVIPCYTITTQHCKPSHLLIHCYYIIYIQEKSWSLSRMQLGFMREPNHPILPGGIFCGPIFEGVSSCFAAGRMEVETSCGGCLLVDGLVGDVLVEEAGELGRDVGGDDLVNVAIGGRGCRWARDKDWRVSNCWRG